MIKIIDDWYITVETNPTNYVVRRGSGEIRDKKKGHRDAPLAYCGSLGTAIKYIRKQIIAEKLSDGSPALSDAFHTISEVDSRFEKIIKGVTA